MISSLMDHNPFLYMLIGCFGDEHVIKLILYYLFCIFFCYHLYVWFFGNINEVMSFVVLY